MKRMAILLLALSLSALLLVGTFAATGKSYSVENVMAILRGLLYGNTTDEMDVNSDGAVTLADGVLALRYAVTQGWKLTKDFDTVISKSGTNWWDRGVQYPRLVELEDGTLLATFEQLNAGLVSGGPSYPIYRSANSGKSWTKITNVRDNATDMQSEWNPQLFVLSKPLGNYAAGTVLLAGCSIDADHTTKSAIRLYASTNGGAKFEAPITVAEGGGSDDGVWEPFLLQLDDGSLVCYYSDDTGTQHSQRIVYKVSSDGVNFSDAVEVVASKKQAERPGMPVVTRLGDGTYFMVYEVVNHASIDGNPVFYRTSTDGLDWGDKTSLGTAIASGSKALGSAPYCTWLPIGADDCGTLIVSGTFMRKGSSSTGTSYFVSTDKGATWSTVNHLISYDATLDHVGYSNCIVASADGRTVYAMNNPTDSSLNGKSKIVFAKATFK